MRWVCSNQLAGLFVLLLPMWYLPEMNEKGLQNHSSENLSVTWRGFIWFVLDNLELLQQTVFSLNFPLLLHHLLQPHLQWNEPDFLLLWFFKWVRTKPLFFQSCWTDWSSTSCRPLWFFVSHTYSKHVHATHLFTAFAHAHNQHLFQFIFKKQTKKEENKKHQRIWCSFLHQRANALKFGLCCVHHCFKAKDKAGQCLYTAAS